MRYMFWTPTTVKNFSTFRTAVAKKWLPEMFCKKSDTNPRNYPIASLKKCVHNGRQLNDPEHQKASDAMRSSRRRLKEPTRKGKCTVLNWQTPLPGSVTFHGPGASAEMSTKPVCKYQSRQLKIPRVWAIKEILRQTSLHADAVFVRYFELLQTSNHQSPDRRNQLKACNYGNSACGVRNKERFRTVIFFHTGGLDLYPSIHWKPKRPFFDIGFMMGSLNAGICKKL